MDFEIVGSAQDPAPPNPALLLARQHAGKIGAVLGVVCLIAFFYEGTVVLEPGVRAMDEPRQVAVAALDPKPGPWLAKEHSFYPLARYSLEAKVLSKERYRMGKEAELSPYDLALGWQQLSDQAIVDQISFSQSGRWYHFRAPSDSISLGLVSLKSANTHIIPADDEVLDVLHDIRKGDMVALEGYLVEARDETSGWKWRSSLSRGDSGAHACEVFWVESAKITTP